VTPERPGRRDFVRATGTVLAGLALAPLAVRAESRFDTVIRGGLVVDGTGLAPFPADIGIVGDRIAEVGSIAADQGRRVLDVAGLHVSPGFIDIHTHSDFDILLYPTADSRVRQGVTTELAGNCGMSAAPLAGAGAEARRREHREAGVETSWTGVASYCDALDRAGMSVNQALLVGQGTVRTNTIGNIDRRLHADELTAVLRAVEAGMDEGAFASRRDSSTYRAATRRPTRSSRWRAWWDSAAGCRRRTSGRKKPRCSKPWMKPSPLAAPVAPVCRSRT